MININFIYFSCNKTKLIKVKDFLKDYNVDIKTVSNSKEVIEQFNSNLINVIFIDETVIKECELLLAINQFGNSNNLIMVFHDKENFCNKYNNLYDIVYLSIESDFSQSYKTITNLIQSKIRPNMLNINKDCLGCLISHKLNNLGFAQRNVGFTFLKECVLEQFLSGSTDKKLFKSVYPAVAEKLNTSTFNIERSIRTAINYAMNNDLLNKLNLEDHNAKITNTFIIRYMIDYVENNKEQFIG